MCRDSECYQYVKGVLVANDCTRKTDIDARSILQIVSGPTISLLNVKTYRTNIYIQVELDGI